MSKPRKTGSKSRIIVPKRGLGHAGNRLRTNYKRKHKW